MNRSACVVVLRYALVSRRSSSRVLVAQELTRFMLGASASSTIHQCERLCSHCTATPITHHQWLLILLHRVSPIICDSHRLHYIDRNAHRITAGSCPATGSPHPRWLAQSSTSAIHCSANDTAAILHAPHRLTMNQPRHSLAIVVGSAQRVGPFVVCRRACSLRHLTLFTSGASDARCITTGSLSDKVSLIAR